jgi:hypothetical protein
LHIFDHFEEVFLWIGQDLACFKLDGFLFAKKSPQRKREELLLGALFLV